VEQINALPLGWGRTVGDAVDEFLYAACWATGEMLQYDVTDRETEALVAFDPRRLTNTPPEPVPRNAPQADHTYSSACQGAFWADRCGDPDRPATSGERSSSSRGSRDLPSFPSARHSATYGTWNPPGPNTTAAVAMWAPKPKDGDRRSASAWPRGRWWPVRLFPRFRSKARPARSAPAVAMRDENGKAIKNEACGPCPAG